MIAEGQERLAPERAFEITGRVLGLLKRGGGDAGHGCTVLDHAGQIADDEDLGMAGDRQVGLDLDAPRTIERHPERPRQG